MLLIVGSFLKDARRYLQNPRAEDIIMKNAKKNTDHEPGDFTDEEIDAIICQWEKNYGE